MLEPESTALHDGVEENVEVENQAQIQESNNLHDNAAEMISFVKRNIKMPSYSDDIWQSEHSESVVDFLRTNHHRGLFIFIHGNELMVTTNLNTTRMGIYAADVR